MLLPITTIAKDEIERIINEAIPDLGEKSREQVSRLEKAIGSVFARLIEALAETLIGLFGSSVKELGYLFGAWNAYKQLGSHEAMDEVRPMLLDSAIMTILLHRGQTDYATIRNELASQGYSDARIDMLIESSKRILDVSAILQAYSIKRISYEEGKRRLMMLGFDEDNAMIILDSVIRFLSVDDYVRLWLRKEISEDELDNRLQMLNLGFMEREWIKSLAYHIPSPPDLIRMAVKEAFSPEIAERFGLYEDFPEEFAHWAEMQGISSFWAKAYWAAHWDLPSPTMGFEMFHRGIIDKDELMLLLRALDIMPFWRDKMIQLSYVPLTRVDIRRMYKLGILSGDDVYRAYLDLGYSPENAERLRQFVEVEAIETERDLTKSELISAFEAGMITEHEVKKELMAMKYSEEEAEVLIALQLYKKEKKIKDAQIKAIRSKYLKNVITLEEAIRRLTALALPATELDTYIELWKTEKLEISEELGLPDLKKALSLGIINKEDFIERVKRKGYNDRDIEIMIELVRKGAE